MEHIAVILPSRGMSFSQTCEELLRELKPFSHKIFFSIGNTLPDCFNIPLEEILKDKKWTHVLIVEDDMIIPEGILDEMLWENHPVVALDYPFQKNGEATTLHDPSGYALYTGTGFMLIQRWVLENMPKPVFTTDTAWDMMITTDNKLLCWGRDVSNIKTYGLHDVHFGITLWSNEIPIKVMDRTAGQRKLKQRGTAGVNAGADSVYTLTKVKRNNTAKTSNTQLIDKYIERLNRVQTVEVLAEPPEGVYYEDGQARIKEKHLVI